MTKKFFFQLSNILNFFLNSLNTYPPPQLKIPCQDGNYPKLALRAHLFKIFLLSISNISLKNMSNYYDSIRTRELHKGRVNIRLHMIDTFNTISPPGLQNIGMENRFPGISYIFSQFVVNIFLP